MSSEIHERDACAREERAFLTCKCKSTDASASQLNNTRDKTYGKSDTEWADAAWDGTRPMSVLSATPLQPSLTLGFPCASLPLRSGYKPFRSGTMITTSARIHALCSGVALVGRVVGTGSATRNLLI